MGKLSERDKLALRNRIVEQAEKAYSIAKRSEEAAERGDYELAEYLDNLSDVHTESLKRLEAEAKEKGVY